MIRSMRDEQMLAKYGYDPKPWVDPTGGRWSRKAVTDEKFAPRPECIPSPDPEPWHCYDCGERLSWPYHIDERHVGVGGVFREPRPWGTFTPDPKFVRTEVNPILSAFREYGDPTFPDSTLRFLEESAWPGASPEQVADARKVLERLAGITTS